MPKVWEQEGFRFIIYPDDHVPSHIHVIKAGEEVVIELGNENEPPDFRENRGMRTKDAVRALEICYELQDQFRSEWKRIHGQEDR
jgi:hypothetical protein